MFLIELVVFVYRCFVEYHLERSVDEANYCPVSFDSVITRSQIARVSLFGT